MENLTNNQVEETKTNNKSSKQFFMEYFKNDILWDQLEEFPKQTNHSENMQLIVGSFINIGYSQTPNIPMRINSLKKLRLYLKHDPNFFFTIFISINNSLSKNLLTEKANSELRKTAYLIYFDFISNYESFLQIDHTKILTFVFKTLTELIIKENSEDPDDIPKMLMNLISNSLFYPEVYSKILQIANTSSTSKHLEICLKVLESLLVNTPKGFLFEVIDWKELFEIFFKKDTQGKTKQEELYVDLFIVMLNLINNDFMQFGLKDDIYIEINDYIKAVVNFKI